MIAPLVGLGGPQKSVQEQMHQERTAKSFASLTNQPQEPELKGDGTMSSMKQIAEKLANINAIAAVCHEANRAYCATLGDQSQPAWCVAPAWQRESALTGVLKIARGEVTRPEQSHESWSAQKVADGWVYGPVKDADAKTHHCLVPFAELPPEQQAKDHLFFAIATTLLGV